MHALRRTTFASRLALCWFVLVLAAGIASPMVRQQALELLCSAGGPPKLVVIGTDQEVAPASTAKHALDCPLCLAATLPPVNLQPAVAVPQVRLQPVAAIYASWIAALHAAPLPARGPPQLA